MNKEQELLQNVMMLLTKAEYRAAGAELVQIAAVIKEFHEWAQGYLSQKAAEVAK